MAAGSLVVRISADLNDFSRQLNAMTKGVDAAAKKVADIGKSMSIGLTIPIVAAAAAMTKFGMEQAAASAKLSREFGPATESIRQEIEKMRSVVPETTSALMQMANQMAQFGQGLNMTTPQAALFSGEALKMAAALRNANPGSTMAETTDALMRGFEGSTKGLKSFGIAIDAGQIKQEAYQLGLLKIGNTLTPLGTALSTYALLTDRVNKLQANSLAVQRDVGTQWAYLKANAIELGESVGVKLLPAFAVLVQAASDLISWFSSLSDGTVRTALYVGVFAAALGPTISLVVELTAGITKLYAATKLLIAGGSLEAVVAVLTNPAFIAGALVLTAAIYGLTKAWEHFSAEASSVKMPATLGPVVDVQQLLKLGGGAPTSTNTKDPLQQFQQQASAVTQAYEDAIKVGDGLTDPFARVVALNQQALSLYGQQTDKLGEMALAARGVAIATNGIINPKGVASALFNGFGTTAQAQRAISASAMNPTEVAQAVGSQRTGDENSLLVRAAALRAKDTFDVLRVAGLNLAEKFVQVSHDFAVEFAEFKSQWSSAGNIGQSALAGLKDGAMSVLQGFTPMALAAAAVGKIMQGFQPILDKLMGPLVAFGQILAQIVQPVLPIVFLSLKTFGIALALIGEVIYTVAGGLAKAIGGLIAAIGSFIKKIPFLGGVGKDIQNFGNSISNLGNSALNTAKQLDQSRIQLQNLDFNDAANGLNTLAGAATATAEALYNLPQAFRINLDRYLSTTPINFPGASGTSGAPASAPAGSGGNNGTGYGGGQDPNNPNALDLLPSSAPLANINIDGKTVAQITVGHLRAAATRQFGSPTRIADVVRIG